MPSQNIIKNFAPDQYYHVYNRGVEKRIIFIDKKDYAVFLGLLKKYLSVKSAPRTITNRHPYIRLEGDVTLLAYCLMPNHYHLLFHQQTADGITRLMRRVCTGYVMYFNERYNRVGGLFQSRYKASLIESDEYLIHTSRYIHRNPEDFRNWPYSSLSNYVGHKHAHWLQTKRVLDYFGGEKLLYAQYVAENL